MLHEASFYEKLSEKKVKCTLCPHNCIIPEGKSGICHVRKNIDGILYSLNYEKLSAVHTDPIEKKPLYHFYPGKNIFSVGSVGCNLKCNFCQNSHISQINIDTEYPTEQYNSEYIVKKALRIRNNIGIAYTYNEPIIWHEYMYETAVKAKEHNLKNVVVTNGYINPEPLHELLPLINAFNVDLKAFTDDFYKKQTKSELNPVLKTIEMIAESGTHIEVTNLIIPGLNDNINDFKKLIKFMVKVFGRNGILHLSRYFPAYKSEIPATPKETLINFYNYAKRHLNFVYLGNIKAESGNNTYCPNCGNPLIIRTMLYSSIVGLYKNKCKNCNHKIPVIY